MADIRPFVATRFAVKNGTNLADLLSPPYDVIDPALQQTLLDRHPNNLVRVDFGKTHPDDNEYENRYSRAGAIWQQWKKDGTLAEDYRVRLRRPRTEMTRMSPELQQAKAHLWGYL